MGDGITGGLDFGDRFDSDSKAEALHFVQSEFKPGERRAVDSKVVRFNAKSLATRDRSDSSAGIAVTSVAYPFPQGTGPGPTSGSSAFLRLRFDPQGIARPNAVIPRYWGQVRFPDNLALHIVDWRLGPQKP